MWSFYLSFCEQDNKAETDVDNTWQAWAMGNPLEVTFWQWSKSACGFRIIFFNIAE